MKFRNPDEVVLAIDYGTSNSLVAAVDREQMTAPLAIDPEAQDPSVFRSVLYFPHGDLCYYGQKAINEYTDRQADGRLVRSVKKFLPSESFVGTWVDNRLMRLEDLIGYFLLEMRKRASAVLGFEPTKVLLGRPAKFSEDSAKDLIAQYRLQKAAEFAGFREIDFLPEPLAAAFELRRQLKEEKTVLVVDLGGGTSDFTVVRIGPRPFQDRDVLAIGGVSVAGDAIDGDFMRTSVAPHIGLNVKYRVPLGRNVLEMPKTLLDHICSPADIAQLQRSDYMHFFKNVHSWALGEEHRRSLERLFTIVEDQQGFRIFEEIDRVKRELSKSSEARFEFNYPTAEIAFTAVSSDYAVDIHKSVDRILTSMDDTLRASQLTRDQIDIVYCTGGTAKLKSIQSGLRQRFPAEKIVGQNYFHSVIEGLAARAQERLQS